MAPNSSQYTLWSLGIVAEHKVVGSRRILATPIEKTPSMDGVLKSDPGLVTTKGVDSLGQAYQAQAISDTTVEATWIGDSNRLTPPDVRRGTRVRLYRMADSDTLYWEDAGLDPHLKRGETVTHAYNNNHDADSENTQSAENSYFTEVSTHTGQITVGTNKSNGEPFAYTVQINTKEGIITAVDDAGNEFTLNSSTLQILALLNTGTEFRLDNNDIFANAPGNISLVAQENITMQCKNYSMVATESYKCQTEDWFVDSPKGTFTGILTVGGLATTTASGYDGKAEIGSELTVKQKFTAEADATVAGNLDARKVTSTEDISAPNV